jgi:hypothetical protein
MGLLGQLATEGPSEPLEDGLDIDLLQRFYGADGIIEHPHPGTTGAGTMPEDSLYPPIDGGHDGLDDNGEDFVGLSEQESATLDCIHEQLASQQQNHVRHPPIKAPRHQNTFAKDEEVIFWEAVEDARRGNYIPQGYGVLPGEWEGGVYPEIEVIQSGNRKRGELEIGLPNDVWFPRALQWAQALHIMSFSSE